MDYNKLWKERNRMDETWFDQWRAPLPNRPTPIARPKPSLRFKITRLSGVSLDNCLRIDGPKALYETLRLDEWVVSSWWANTYGVLRISPLYSLSEIEHYLRAFCQNWVLTHQS